MMQRWLWASVCMSHSIHNAARPEGSPWTECVAHQRIKNTVRRHQPRSTANDSSRNVPNADTKDRRATLISSGNLSVSRAVEDDKPLTERAQLSAGGFCPDQTSRYSHWDSCWFDDRWPFWIRAVWGFSEDSHVCYTEWQDTHTYSKRESVVDVAALVLNNLEEFV